MSRRFTQLLITTALIFVLTIAIGSQARAGTATVTFGWEDGTSEVLGEFISGGAGVSYANTTSGMEVDYGPSSMPFDTPVPYDVTPLTGSQMLEINVNPVSETTSNAVRPFLGYVQHLDDGDIIQFSFSAYDPSDGRSPSVLTDGIYAQNDDINSFAGFFPGPFQEFPPGDGWLTMVHDQMPDGVTFPVDPNLVFDEGIVGDREAVVLRASPFRPSLSRMSDGGSGTYKFFIDDLRISVTSGNPLASITLPDGSVTLVNPTTVSPDFNGDTFVNELDIDLLTMEIAFAADPDEATFDLNGDGVVNLNDITDAGDGWLAQAGAINLTSMNPYLVGDSGLDGTVDGQDFVDWNNNKFTTTGKWTEGDFNADGETDGQDFVLWNGNKFMTADGFKRGPRTGYGLDGRAARHDHRCLTTSSVVEPNFLLKNQQRQACAPAVFREVAAQRPDQDGFDCRPSCMFSPQISSAHFRSAPFPLGLPQRDDNWIATVFIPKSALRRARPGGSTDVQLVSGGAALSLSNHGFRRGRPGRGAVSGGCAGSHSVVVPPGQARRKPKRTWGYRFHGAAANRPAMFVEWLG